MKELAQTIAAKAQASLGVSGFFFEKIDLSQKRFATSHITEDTFCALATIPTEQTIIFVDGGNNTLIDSPSLHVSAMRVAVVKQTNEKLRPKFSQDIFTATCTISLEKIEGKKKYVLDVQSDEIHKSNELIPLFDSIEIDDELISRVEENRVMMTLCNHVRQTLEWHFAKNAVTGAKPGSLLVLDGSVTYRNRNQEDKLSCLINTATKNNVLVVGISKSSTLTTTGGYALGPFLMSHSPTTQMWMTKSLAKSLSGIYFDIYFAKLAGRSENVVRIDIASEQTNSIDIAKVIGIIAWISQDASFPGYPYGLIKADDLARVTQEEREYQTTRLMLSLDPLTQKQIRMICASSSAHSILDSLKF